MAWRAGLPAGHRLPYTGDAIELASDGIGGPYVLETRKGAGIDAARRNAGMARWLNDPRGATDETGQPRRANCKFVCHTPRGSRQRVAAVRTLRAVPKGEELWVSYGNQYWRYHAPDANADADAQPNSRRRKRQRNSTRARKQPAAAGAVAVAVTAVVTRAAAAAAAAASDANTQATQQQQQQQRPTPPPSTPPSATPPPNATPPPAPQPGRQRAGASTREPLLSAVRRAAAADSEYAALLLAPTPDLHVNRGVLWDSQQRMRVPSDRSLRTRLLSELHDTPTGVHCGRDRMLADAQRRFVWRGMASDVEQYVSTCDACQRNKHSKRLQPGLLMPLPLPAEPCLHWTTDAVTGLPRTKRGYDAIQVFVDRLTKLKHFAPARKTDDGVALADTTLRTIIAPHGMPKSMVSDRDPRITGRYWRELSRLLGSEVNLSTAHHPQSDGQSEREIQTLITALRSYSNAKGDDWDTFLPAFELAFNSKQQASTGVAPFTLVYGTEPRLPLDCQLDDARPSAVPAAEERAANMRRAMDMARSNGERAQARQKRYADRHRRLQQLKAGDEVLLSTEDLQLRSGMHKLTGQYIGPFRVVGCVNDNSVTLDLPPLLSALHPTVNITRLKPYKDGRTAFPDRPLRFSHPPAVDRDTNGAPQWEVECLLASRGSDRRRELLIRWKGYGPEHDEWRRRSWLVRSAPLAVEEFDARQQGRPARDGSARAT